MRKEFLFSGGPNLSTPECTHVPLANFIFQDDVMKLDSRFFDDICAEKMRPFVAFRNLDEIAYCENRSSSLLYRLGETNPNGYGLIIKNSNSFAHSLVIKNQNSSLTISH